jgi:hypothetical protein
MHAHGTRAPPGEDLIAVEARLSCHHIAGFPRSFLLLQVSKKESFHHLYHVGRIKSRFLASLAEIRALPTAGHGTFPVPYSVAAIE